jgi:hypothetical protein
MAWTVAPAPRWIGRVFGASLRCGAMRLFSWASAVLVAACTGTAAAPDPGRETDAGAPTIPADDAMPTDSHAPPVPIDEAPDRAGIAMCEGLAACCASRNFAFSPTACAAAVRGGVTADSLCPSGTTYDPQAAGDCIAMARAAYAACSQPVGAAAAVCARICVGSTPVGGTCRSTKECEGGQTGTVQCFRAEGPTGVCSQIARGQAGDACDTTCSARSSSQEVECVPVSRKALDAPSGGARCYTSDNLYCAMDGTCTAQKPAGAPCNGTDECVGVCDYGTGRCADAHEDASLDVSAAACANPKL